MSVNDKFASFVEALMEGWVETSPDCYEFDGLGVKAKIEKDEDGKYVLHHDNSFIGMTDVFSSIRSAKLYFADYLNKHVIPTMSYKQKTGIDPSGFTEREVIRVIEDSVTEKEGVASYNFYKDGKLMKQIYIYDKGFDGYNFSSFVNQILMNNGRFMGLVSRQRLEEQGYLSLFNGKAIYEWELQNGTFVTIEVGCIKLDDFQYENKEVGQVFDDCCSQS